LASGVGCQNSVHAACKSLTSRGGAEFWHLTGERKQLKSDAGRRDVVLMPEMAQLLRRHKAASRYSQEDDFVFCSRAGTPLHLRSVETRGFDAAVTRAKLQRSDGKPVLHDCP